MARCAGCSSNTCNCNVNSTPTVLAVGDGSTDNPWEFHQPAETGAPLTIISDGGGNLIAATPGTPYTPTWSLVFNGPPGEIFVGEGPTDIVVNGSNQVIAGLGGTWSDGSFNRRFFLCDMKILNLLYDTDPFGAGQYINFNLNLNNRYQAWILNHHEDTFYRTFVVGLYPGDNITPFLTSFGGLGFSSASWTLTVFKIARG